MNKFGLIQYPSFCCKVFATIINGDLKISRPGGI
jgi:hypothetical protein